MKTSTKVAIAALTLALVNAAVVAAPKLSSLFLQESTRAGDHDVTVLTDMRRNTVCYIADSKFGGSAPVAISCVKQN